MSIRAVIPSGPVRHWESVAIEAMMPILYLNGTLPVLLQFAQLDGFACVNDGTSVS